MLHVGNFERPRPLPKRPIDVLLQSFSISRNHRFTHETSQPPAGVELVGASLSPRPRELRETRNDTDWAAPRSRPP